VGQQSVDSPVSGDPWVSHQSVGSLVSWSLVSGLSVSGFTSQWRPVGESSVSGSSVVMTQSVETRGESSVSVVTSQGVTSQWCHQSVGSLVSGFTSGRCLGFSSGALDRLVTVFLCCVL
jgi:hypothetical protein